MMKLQIISLRIAGGICLLFTLFHCLFYSLFHWDVALNCLSVSDRGILLTYHWISILILGFMSAISLMQSRMLIASQLRFSILIMFCLFFVIRIVAEFIYFGLNPSSWVILPLCIAPIILFTIPMFKQSEQ